MKTTITENWSNWSHGPQPCLTQWNYEPCHVGPPKTDRSWWRILTKCGPLEKRMANHFLPWEPHVTAKFGLGEQNEAGQWVTVLPRECTSHSKHPLPTTHENTVHMDIKRWSIPKSDWFYYLQPKIEKLYTVTKNKTRSWLWLRSWIPYCQIQT